MTIIEPPKKKTKKIFVKGKAKFPKPEKEIEFFKEDVKRRSINSKSELEIIELDESFEYSGKSSDKSSDKIILKSSDKSSIKSSNKSSN